jgi:type II secretory pathway pseudopilin PulG
LRCSWLCFVALGQTLVDRVQTVAVQEQKQNVLEYQRKTQYESRLQAQKTDLAGLISAPPSAFDPASDPVLNSPLVYNALQLPSPDAERDELVNYIIAISQYASFTASTIYAGNILNSDFVFS